MNPSQTHPLEHLSMIFLRASVFLTERAIRHKALITYAKEIGLICTAAGMAYLLGRVVGHFLQTALS
jgi:hypothetical protein